MIRSRQIHLVRRPRGVPVAADFALVDGALGDPGEGELLVQGVLMSVDPYMRPRLDADQALDQPLPGGGIGRVVQSRHPDYAVGDLVRHGSGFSEAFVSDGTGLTRLRPDPDLPLSVYLHALGGTGLTAYGGLLRVGALREGEQVVVSTAGGAVGSVAAQIARIHGCHVVGITGADDKAAWLRDEVGLDAVINYKVGLLTESLAAATPKGIDVYFENVGGAHLDAALLRMNVGGRIPVCGMISSYNGAPQGVTGLFNLIYRRVRMEGFVATDFAALGAEFARAMTGWLKDGRIRYQETMLDGFERAPEALIGLFEGRNTGKMLVRLGD